MAGSQAILSQDSLETILAQLPIGRMAIDPQGIVDSCNPASLTSCAEGRIVPRGVKDGKIGGVAEDR